MKAAEAVEPAISNGAGVAPLWVKRLCDAQAILEYGHQETQVSLLAAYRRILLEYRIRPCDPRRGECGICHDY
jgi:hypothetical protein